MEKKISDEEVLSKLEEAPKQVGKLSRGTKVIASETKLDESISTLWSQMGNSSKARRSIPGVQTK